MPGFAQTAHTILDVLRDGLPRTRSDLAAATGQARSTVSNRLDELVARGLVIVAEETAQTRGRPSSQYVFQSDARVICAAELGASHVTAAITDLLGTPLGHERIPLDIADGPVAVLGQVVDCFERLLTALNRPTSDVIGVGLGLPGPVEHSTGRAISPPIMPGWDRFDVIAEVQRRFEVPVLVDNDVNLIALGEWVRHWPDQSEALVLKVATGIGAGLISSGTLVRGAQGAAGDIGHVWVPEAADRLCRCGQTGCLETFASARGIAETLREANIPAHNAQEVVDLARFGDMHAIRAIREAGRAIGGVLATCVCMVNPGLIVVGGDLARAGEPLLAGIREVIYQRSQPLATTALRISASEDVEVSGIVGASRMVQDAVLFSS